MFYGSVVWICLRFQVGVWGYVSGFVLGLYLRFYGQVLWLVFNSFRFFRVRCQGWDRCFRVYLWFGFTDRLDVLLQVFWVCFMVCFRVMFQGRLEVLGFFFRVRFQGSFNGFFKGYILYFQGRFRLEFRDRFGFLGQVLGGIVQGYVLGLCFRVRCQGQV